MQISFKKKPHYFSPSGTMSNLIAILTWCSSRGSEVIVGDKSHIFLLEQSGASQFGGISYNVIKNNEDGTMDLSDIKNSIHDFDIHKSNTNLICIENTHCACGGKILPLNFISELKKIVDSHKIPVHMDGARIWNAITASKIKPYEIVKNIDSISVSLSKGLGAPVGSLLIGTKEFIKKANRVRQALGGKIWKTSILAAVGLIAIDDFESGILQFDHTKTQEIAKQLKNLTNLQIHKDIQTNIIFIDIPKGNANYVSILLKKKNIFVSVWSSSLLRLVIHRDINNEKMNNLIAVFTQLDKELEDINKFG